MNLGLFAREQLEITPQGEADRADAAHGLRNLQPAAGTAGHKKKRRVALSPTRICLQLICYDREGEGESGFFWDFLQTAYVQHMSEHSSDQEVKVWR